MGVIISSATCNLINEQNNKQTMKKNIIYVNDVLKYTKEKKMLVIKTNNPSITIRKGFSFLDTYKAAVVQTLDNIENSMLNDRKDPNKVGYLQLVTVAEYQLKFAESFSLNTGFPLSEEQVEESQIDINHLTEIGYHRFKISDNGVSPIGVENLANISEYFTVHPIGNKEQHFDIYRIKIKPNMKEHTVFDYTGAYKKVKCSEFEFLYKEQKDFIGIKNLDVVEIH